MDSTYIALVRSSMAAANEDGEGAREAEGEEMNLVVIPRRGRVTDYHRTKHPSGKYVRQGAVD